MTIREEYEDLKYDLMVRLEDASVISILDCPFDFYVTEEEDDKYFVRGSRVRLETKKMLIMLDNSYAKSRLFPSNETADMFVDVMEQTLADFKNAVIEAFKEEPLYFTDFEDKEYFKYIDKFIQELKKAAEPFIEKLRTTSQHEVEMEVRARDNFKKMNDESQMKFAPDKNKRFGWI